MRVTSKDHVSAAADLVGALRPLCVQVSQMVQITGWEMCVAGSKATAGRLAMRTLPAQCCVQESTGAGDL